MWMFIRMAVRNVHKNLKSMTLNGIGIALTVFLLVFIFSLSRGIENQIVQRNIQFETGGVMIRLDKDLIGWENQTEGDSIYRIILSVLDTHKEVKSFRPRISVRNASLYGNEGVQRIQVEGIRSEEYPLLNEMISLSDGNIGGDMMANGILISSELSEESGLKLMDECAIVLPSADGSVNMLDYVVTGIYQNTSHADKYRIYMSYEQAKELYHVNLPTLLLIDLVELETAELVAGFLASEVDSQEVEIKTYKDFMGRARALSGINRSALLGLTFFLLFISFVGIWAMIVEQVNERSVEIKTLLTFGFTRGSIRQVFLMESLYVSLLFLSIGILAIVLVIGIIDLFDGLYLGRLASFAFGSAIIQPELKVHDLLFAAGIALLYPLLATWFSLYSMKSLRPLKSLKPLRS